MTDPLPPLMEAELKRLGVLPLPLPATAPDPDPHWVSWRPTKDQPEPPF